MGKSLLGIHLQYSMHTTSSRNPIFILRRSAYKTYSNVGQRTHGNVISQCRS